MSSTVPTVKIEPPPREYQQCPKHQEVEKSVERSVHREEVQ